MSLENANSVISEFDNGRRSLSDAFRLVYREIAGVVAVVTTADAVGKSALTMTAVTTVSLDPPSVLICINRTASAFPVLMRGAGFCVNYLTHEHEQIARLCSDRAMAETRLDDPAFETGDTQIPTLKNSKASIICNQDGRYLYGTHAIVIGRVTSIRQSPGEPALMYADGAFSRWQATHESASQASSSK